MRADYPSRRTAPLLGMVATGTLLVSAFLLGLFSFAKMKQVVTEEFMGQQLVLAENLAALMEQDLDFLRRELRVLNMSPSIQYAEYPSLASRLRVTMGSIKGDELLQIRLISPGGRSATVMGADGAVSLEEGDFTGDRYYRWTQSPASRDHVLVDDAPVALSERLGGRPLLIMAIPNYQASPDEAHPHPTERFSGVLLLVLDASAVARRFTEKARSGSSGYAWVIDERGTFLAHPMSQFVGKNAFKARPELDPSLGFEGINTIMRDRMMRGQKGTGEYVSGWHRQMRGPVRKLMGFCPVEIDPERPELVWSVAVVAPASEVQGLAGSLFLRQLFMQAAIVLALVAGAISVVRRERYWNRIKKQREREANLSSRLASLGTLAAGVAHEINNPLAIMLGFTEELLEGAPTGSRTREQLEIIERQGLACKKIVENLGRFARIPERRGETTDVNEEVRRTAAIVQNTLLTEKIQCRLALEEGLPPAAGDPQGFQQVLLNLITNARGAMKKGGVLSLSSWGDRDRICVSVGDTGHGIRSGDLGRIFDPFFTTKAPGEGTGLGLSISHGIVEAAGGTLSVESRHEGEMTEGQSGTTFTIRLPKARRHYQAPWPDGGAQ